MKASTVVPIIAVALLVALGGKRKQKTSSRKKKKSSGRNKLYAAGRKRYVRERNAKIQSYAGISDEEMAELEEAGLIGEGDLYLAQADMAEKLVRGFKGFG